MYASYGLNSRTQLSWPPIIHRLTFLITIQGRRNVKNFDGNKPINGQDLLTLPFMGKKLVGTSPPTSSYVPAADYSQEMHNYKYKLTYFLAFKSLS